MRNIWSTLVNSSGIGYPPLAFQGRRYFILWNLFRPENIDCRQYQHDKTSYIRLYLERTWFILLLYLDLKLFLEVERYSGFHFRPSSFGQVWGDGALVRNRALSWKRFWAESLSSSTSLPATTIEQLLRFLSPIWSLLSLNNTFSSICLPNAQFQLGMASQISRRQHLLHQSGIE